MTGRGQVEPEGMRQVAVCALGLKLPSRGGRDGVGINHGAEEANGMAMQTVMATTEAVSPKPILELGAAFWGAKALHSAVQLGLFSQLSSGPATATELRERLGLHPRAASDFLDALVALGMLVREDGKYRNSASADAYLDEGKPTYIGGWMGMADRMLYPVWSRLSDGLRTGQPQAQGLDSDGSFPRLHRDEAFFADFVAAMDAYTGMLGPELAAVVDWSQYSSFVDAGGSRGNLAVRLIAAHPHLSGTVFDLSNLEPFFAAHTASSGLGDQLKFQAGDFFTEPIPGADAIVFGHVLHDWDVAERQQLIRNAYEALPAGGVLLVYDRMIDDGRRDRALSLLGCLNLLLVTPGGSEYTVAEGRGWLGQAGFSHVEAIPVAGDTETLLVAKK